MQTDLPGFRDTVWAAIKEHYKSEVSAGEQSSGCLGFPLGVGRGVWMEPWIPGFFPLGGEGQQDRPLDTWVLPWVGCLSFPWWEVLGAQMPGSIPMVGEGMEGALMSGCCANASFCPRAQLRWRLSPPQLNPWSQCLKMRRRKRKMKMMMREARRMSPRYTLGFPTPNLSAPPGDNGKVLEDCRGIPWADFPPPPLLLLPPGGPC